MGNGSDARNITGLGDEARQADSTVDECEPTSEEMVWSLYRTIAGHELPLCEYQFDAHQTLTRAVAAIQRMSDYLEADICQINQVEGVSVIVAAAMMAEEYRLRADPGHRADVLTRVTVALTALNETGWHSFKTKNEAIVFYKEIQKALSGSKARVDKRLKFLREAQKLRYMEFGRKGPEKYDARKNKKELSIEFFKRVYGQHLNRMRPADLHRLDKALYDRLCNKCRRDGVKIASLFPSVPLDTALVGCPAVYAIKSIAKIARTMIDKLNEE